MTFTWLIIVLVGLVFSGIAYTQIMGDDPAPSVDETLGPSTSLWERRHNLGHTVVHEAGHATTAWFDPYTTKIDRISAVPWGNTAGYVQWSYVRMPTAGCRWYSLTVCLGGCAGEIAAHGKMRGTHAKKDLAEARAIARQIPAGSTPPWRLDEDPDAKLDFMDVFKEGTLTPDEARAINHAYRRALYLIKKDKERFIRVAVRLDAKKVLDAQDIEKLFGPRPVFFRGGVH